MGTTGNGGHSYFSAIFHPQQQVWPEHFEWAQDSSISAAMLMRWCCDRGALGGFIYSNDDLIWYDDQ
jgi:hypothetical protein